jgi:MoxR-like ATPase
VNASTATLEAPAPRASGREDAEFVQRTAAAIRTGVRHRIVGLDDPIEQILITLFTRSHALLEGVPGLAKTLLLSTVAQLLDLTFSRIQFTPDLMPGDITGSEYLVQDASGQREFRFAEGPIFANVVLADEINRAPPKTQAALMEAMEERQVTSVGVTRRLDEPFFVLATQNPIEQQGTYPLPAAQLDRFLLKVTIDYPGWSDEERIARLAALPGDKPLRPVASKADLLRIQRIVAEAPVSPDLVRYAVLLAQASRPAASTVPGLADHVEWGVGPRAGQALILGAKARALIEGRAEPGYDDVIALAPGVFRHRLVLSYAAEADEVGPDQIVQRILEHVPGPGRDRRPRPPPLWRRLLRALFAPPKSRR